MGPIAAWLNDDPDTSTAVVRRDRGGRLFDMPSRADRRALRRIEAIDGSALLVYRGGRA